MSNAYTQIQFAFPANVMPHHGIAVVSSLDEDGNPTMNVSVFGQVSTSVRMGLLQAALDRERQSLTGRWKEE